MTLDPNTTYKVFHMLSYCGRNVGMFTSNLQYDEPDWYLVFDWCDRGEGFYPSLRHAIDLRRLKAVKSSAYDFMIEMPVEIPESDKMTELIRREKARNAEES